MYGVSVWKNFQKESIRFILKERPTYDYKRFTTMVNRLRLSLGHPHVNKKGIYRVMKKYGLVLPKNKSQRTYTPTGKIMTLHSNTRWCSDGFEIQCFNGEKVYVLFVLDTCDRGIISYMAKSSPLLALDVQGAMMRP